MNIGKQRVLLLTPKLEYPSSFETGNRAQSNTHEKEKMITNNEASKLMARGLTYQATGELKRLELNRQIVAINNFAWRTDQLIAKRDHEKAAKMLQKAVGVAGRMEEPVEEIQRELRIRKRLLEEREKIMPFLRFSSTAPQHEYRMEVLHASTVGPRFADELVCLQYVRNEIFLQDSLGIPPGVEMDDRDPTCKHFIIFLGDAIVGGARVWYQDAATAVLDRIFVVPEHRGRGLARKLFSAITCDPHSGPGERLLIAIRNDPPESESQRIRSKLTEKLLASGQFRMVQANMFLPHAGMAGSLGAGVHVSLMETIIRVT